MTDNIQFDSMNVDDEMSVDAGNVDVKQLLAELANHKQQLAEVKNSYIRAHADFDNFRKRMRAERDHEFSRGSDKVILELLPIIDDFERALDAVHKALIPEAMTKGVDLIYRQLMGVLDRYNIVQMEAEGQPFDPKFHDAVVKVVNDDLPEHTVIGIVQKGYTKNGELFRPARVAVSVSSEEPISEA